MIIFKLIYNELNNNTKEEKTIFYICTFGSCLLGIVYRSYLIELGYEYGLANLDMQYYVSLAESIKNSSLSQGFGTISSHWNFLDVNIVQVWGYRFYIYFLLFAIFKWSFFPVELSIYLVSIWQLLLASFSMIIIYNALNKRYIKYKAFSLIMLLTTPAVWYACVRLLREPFILICMAIMVKCIVIKSRNWKQNLIVSLIILTIFRPYYSAFMLPFLFLLNSKVKTAFWLETIIFICLTCISLFSGKGIFTILGVLLSPNYINQVDNILNSTVNVYTLGGQIPLIVFIGSIWNIFMCINILMSLCLCSSFDLKNWCCFALILNICILYAVALDGESELRHKMFFVVPFVLLLNSSYMIRYNNNTSAKKDAYITFIVVNFTIALALLLYFMIRTILY